MNCNERCKYFDSCEQSECLLEYNVKDKNNRKKQRDKYYKSKKQIQLIYTDKEGGD